MSKHTVKDFKQSNSETTAKDIILEELDEQGHPVMVEDVIVWALELYAKEKVGFWGGIIANCIVERIKDQEQLTVDRERWSRDLDQSMVEFKEDKTY